MPNSNKITDSIYERGQALLIILLVMSVVLTAVLSISSRSVSDISISTYEEESVRAFNAAEAGVEEGILQLPAAVGTTITKNLPNSSTYNTILNVPITTNNTFIYPGELLPGESATVWFVSHDTNGNLTCSGADCVSLSNVDICWGGPNSVIGSDLTPAVEVTFYWDNTWDDVSPYQATQLPNKFTDIRASRIAIDPWSTRRLTNNFLATSPGNCSFAGQFGAFRFQRSNLRVGNQTTAPADDVIVDCDAVERCILKMEVKLLYSQNSSTLHGQQLGIHLNTSGSTKMPSQGVLIESEGVAGLATRRLSVYQTFPEAPYIFSSSVFSKGGLVK